MAINKELELLFQDEHTDLDDWVIGKIPKHLKRLSVDEKEALRLAKLGASKMMAYYGIKTFYCQSLIAGAIFDKHYDEVIVVTPSQYGKLIKDDVPVLTRKGWKQHGNLEVGDEVISPNGEFVKVTYVHPKQHTDRIVVLETGEEIECHHNHEWVVNYRNTKTNEKSTKTRSVAEMEERGLIDTDGHRRYVIPYKQALIGEHKELPVDPYVLGVWLGDGSTTKGQICSCKDDIAVLDKCREVYPDGAEWVHKDTGVITRGFSGLLSDLRKLGLGDTEKHIPETYLTASIEQRLQLLAGLIDTDGYTFSDERYGKNSRVYFTTASEKLKDTFESLVATFGWRISTFTVEPRLSSSGIQGKKPYYRISFQPDMDIPVVLERKRIAYKSKKRGIGITEIRKCEPHQGNCITVEGGVYCVGEHLIPTHNSFLLGHISNARAYEGNPQFVAASTANLTQMIMQYVVGSVQSSAPEMRNMLLNKKNDLDRLATSISKTRVAYKSGGFVESITLGDTYTDNLGTNKALGRAGDYIVDEAALVSEKSFIEMGRREFSNISHEKNKLIMLSNPHNPGIFYDKLTQANPSKSTFILWMDSLTAVEEQRFSKETVFNSDFAKNKSTLRRYLLCILDQEGGGMFDVPKTHTKFVEGEYTQYFLGVDAAYKGKDNISIALVGVDSNGIRVEDVQSIEKGSWIDGVTSKDIIENIVRIDRKFHCANVCIDVGYGVWLVEGLIQRGVNAHGINFASQPTKERVRSRHYSATNAENMRAEMHLDLQNLIDDGAISFSVDAYDKVKGVLPYVTSERKATGKIKIVPKEQIKAVIKKSPDELDAVLLAIHAAITFMGDAVMPIV